MSNKKYYLLGHGITKSLSPMIHNTIFKYKGEKANYTLKDTSEKEFLDNIHFFRKHSAGFNITIPYKVRLLDFLDEADETVKQSGAVNTVRVENGRFIGSNTDIFGLEKMLKAESVSIKNKKAFLLGSGGAARAVIQVLLQNGISSVRIYARATEKVEQLCAHFEAFSDKFQIWDMKESVQSDLIFNTLPPTVETDFISTLFWHLQSSTLEFAMDLSYGRETFFLNQMRRKRVFVRDGLPMLISQALQAQIFWGNVENFEFDRIYDIISNEAIIRNYF